MILYHGSRMESFVPTYGLGKEQHDYGKGFYLTDSIDLAREWAVAANPYANGWVHAYDLDMTGLRILDFAELGPLAWLAELLTLGDFGIQYFVQSDRAFAALRELGEKKETVLASVYYEKYNQRDSAARMKMYDLVENDPRNKLDRTFKDVI